MRASIRFRPVGRLVLVTAMLAATGCKSDSFKPEPIPEPSELFWDVEIDKRAVTMSTTPPYDTLTLVATPRNYQGEILDGLPKPEFISADPTIVRVTSDGVLTAVAPGSRAVQVMAVIKTDKITHSDTINIRVVDDPAPPVLEAFSVQPLPPDSAKWYATNSEGVGVLVLNRLVRVTYAGSAPVPMVSMDTPDGILSLTVPDVLVSFRSADTTVAHVRDQFVGFSPLTPTTADKAIIRSELKGKRQGGVDIYASLTYFGVTKVDTLHFRVGYPLEQVVDLRPRAESRFVDRPAVIVGTGGLVTWTNFTTDIIQVVFADPTNVRPFNENTFYPPDVVGLYCFLLPAFGSDCTTGGNFTSLVPTTTPFGQSVTGRIFSVPGVYEYHNEEGETAKVIVSDE